MKTLRPRILPSLLVCAAALAAFGTAAQQPDEKRWTSAAGVPLLENEARIWLDHTASMRLQGINAGDPKPYPFLRVLVTYRDLHRSDLGSRRSRIELIVFDCAGRRTQSIQSRVYTLPDGRGTPTMIAGTLSSWTWDKTGGQAQDARISAAVLQRYCPAGG